jgi:coenzyme F420 hydrogenase subunit beta
LVIARNDKTVVTNMVNCKSKIQSHVVERGLCIGCGLCVAIDESNSSNMQYKKDALVPVFSDNSCIPDYAWLACPGKGVDYPDLYKWHYGRLPEDWRLGCYDSVWTGYAVDSSIRGRSSSGGVLTTVLSYLLQENYVDAVIVASQGTSNSCKETSWNMVYNSDELINFGQSVYINVPMLEVLGKLDNTKKYAITLTPESSAALRSLQKSGDKQSLAVKYVLGPYTGTSLESDSIDALLKMYGVSNNDKLVSLKWRAGKWPGYFEAKTESGKVIRVDKVYYNFLIPFYISKISLRSMDFANEFTDLSVGDAWSPKFEADRRGHCVVVCRNPKMRVILNNLAHGKILNLTQIDPLEASDMHGHMIDFKKRGSYIRNNLARYFGIARPDIGIHPDNIGFIRVAIEMINITVFSICRIPISRFLMKNTSPDFLGKIFNFARLLWKSLSKPTKRHGLRTLTCHLKKPRWSKYND